MSSNSILRLLSRCRHKLEDIRPYRPECGSNFNSIYRMFANLNLNLKSTREAITINQCNTLTLMVSPSSCYGMRFMYSRKFYVRQVRYIFREIFFITQYTWEIIKLTFESYSSNRFMKLLKIMTLNSYKVFGENFKFIERWFKNIFTSAI